MNLIDNIDPKPALRRRILHLFPDIPDVLHAVVGGGVNLHHVQGGAGSDIFTDPAMAAGTSIHRLLTIYRPGKYLGNTGLSGASGAAKQVSVAYAP